MSCSVVMNYSKVILCFGYATVVYSFHCIMRPKWGDSGTMTGRQYLKMQSSGHLLPLMHLSILWDVISVTSSEHHQCHVQ